MVSVYMLYGAMRSLLIIALLRQVTVDSTERIRAKLAFTSFLKHRLFRNLQVLKNSLVS